MSAISAPSIDFYTFIHKSLRRQLSEVMTAVGAADFTDPTAMMSLSSQLEQLLGRLRTHAQHEEKFLHPLLAQYLTEAKGKFTMAHEKQEAWLDALERDFHTAAQARSPEQGAKFARELGRFIGYYFVHLAEEEDLNADINVQIPQAELEAAMSAFRASRSSDEVTRDLELILPALNRQDRLAILGPLETRAPGAFIFVMDVARRVLDLRTLVTLEADLGIGSTGTDT